MPWPQPHPRRSLSPRRVTDQQLPISGWPATMPSPASSAGSVELVAPDRGQRRGALSPHPQPGWPGISASAWSMPRPEGLTVHVHARNPGEEPVPFGFAAHPYVATGGAAPAYASPCRPSRIDGRSRNACFRWFHRGGKSACDFRTGGALGAVGLDTARPPISCATAGGGSPSTASPPAGSRSGGSRTPVGAQVFDEKGHAAARWSPIRRDRHQPMSRPADAFNSGTDLAGSRPARAGPRSGASPPTWA